MTADLDSQEPAAREPRSGSSARNLLRAIAFLFLLCLIAIAVHTLFFTQRGQFVLHHPREIRGDVVHFVSRHPLTAPLAYIALYILLGVLALPLWWLQIIGGAAFGLPLAVLYSQTASVIGAVVAAEFSHWLAADLFHKLEDRLVQLRKLDETFGHNGLLVVMAVRLAHVLPFGLSNYAFGLTTVRPRDIALGTLLGGLPAVTTYVAIGTGGHPLRNWRFICGILVLNALLMVPLLVHYFWFRPRKGLPPP